MIALLGVPPQLFLRLTFMNKVGSSCDSCFTAARIYVREEKVKQIRDGRESKGVKSDSYGSCSDRSGISVGDSSFLSDSERKEISKAYEKWRPPCFPY